ncbi:ABC transporter permease [Fervidobacterium pennivorans subsp. shakshaketiis]|uniref:ABC-type multidrug transport system, permease component n=1 Tax=Fervidobacterium pennivorans (strain DSM 9078 / Ven5) TaxID=771875 RepID=H9UC26_FERPD|nr:ABC transporter permease [Fervidobacterium pennivorans]AFG35069.1 ABC-type multidrug transport system, permease component [Fervidobacterium pennivorans DSM 9078]QIV78522.1 ABC transporter permease [Fervidobacterium pennivorans subsp. keratinolyticus]
MKPTKTSSLIELFISLFKQFFLRSKESVFWLVIFPTILFLILTTIFGNVEENVELKVKILGESKMLENIFSDIKQFKAEFIIFASDAEKSSKLKELDNELRPGKIHAFVVLPENFDSEFSIATILQKTKFQRKVLVNIYYVPIRQESKLAGDILSSVFNSLGTREEVSVETYKLSEGEFEYNEFIYPGVIGMAILSVFIFGFMSEVEYLYRRGMLRRFYTTPINIINILIFTALVNMIELILGISVLSLFANLKGVDVGKYLPSMVLHVSIACVLLTLLSLNVLIFSKNKPSRIFVLGQIYFQVQMFAGGFYFPLKFANPVVKNFARFLPLTYTVDALRLPKHLNGFEKGHILVPIIYILLLGVNLLIFSKRLKVAEQ